MDNSKLIKIKEGKVVSCVDLTCKDPLVTAQTSGYHQEGTCWYQHQCWVQSINLLLIS
jgi:hypothetical protein